jgi:transposase
MKAYVGVDWSATEVACALAEGDGPVRRMKGARRTFASVKALVDSVRERRDVSEVLVLIEVGAPGWAELFHQAGATVFVADPKQAKAFAASVCSSGAKDDARDAENLVGMLRGQQHRLKEWAPKDDQRAQLDELGSMHEALSQDVRRAEQRVRGLLRERMPAVDAAIYNLSKPWALRLLREAPTPWHAARLGDEGLDATLTAGRARPATRAKVREAYAHCAAPWLTEVAARAHAVHLRQLVDQLEFLARQLAEVEAQMDELTADLDLRKTLESVSGVALLMSSRLMQYAFDDEEPSHRDAAGVRIGACPVFSGSGRTPKGTPKGRARMRRATDPRARATSYLLGRQAALQLGWAKRMYADARQRGQNAATAYRRIARSLLRILTAMIRTGEAYDDARYVAALRAKGVAWADEPTESAA